MSGDAGALSRSASSVGLGAVYAPRPPSTAAPPEVRLANLAPVGELRTRLAYLRRRIGRKSMYRRQRMQVQQDQRSPRRSRVTLAGWPEHDGGWDSGGEDGGGGDDGSSSGSSELSRWEASRILDEAVRTSERRMLSGGGSLHDVLKRAGAAPESPEDWAEFYKEVRRIAKRLLDEKQAALQTQISAEYMPLAREELASVRRAAKLPQQSAIPLMPCRLGHYTKRNLTRRVKLDVEARMEAEWTMSKMIPVARAHLTSVVAHVASLVGNPEARSLRLAKLQLSAVPSQVAVLPQLTALDMSDNYVSSLPLALTRLTNLMSLDLSRNALRNLPHFVGAMTSLTNLELSGNHVRALPDSMTALPALHTLDLSNNSFDEYPAVLASAISLVNLNVAHNALTRIPAMLGALSLLVVLDLSHNALVTLPSEVGQLAQLQVLLLSHNTLRSLPPALCSLRSLQRLSVDHNQLMHLPAGIGRLRSLARLDVSHNWLTTLPPSVGFWRTLEAFNIDYNLWITMPWSVFDLVAATRSISLDPESRYSLDNWLADFCEPANVPENAPSIPVSLYTPAEVRVIHDAVAAGHTVLQHMRPLGYNEVLERRIALSGLTGSSSRKTTVLPAAASLAAATLMSRMGKAPVSLGVRKARRRLDARSRFLGVVNNITANVRKKHSGLRLLQRHMTHHKPKPPPPPPPAGDEDV
ncbi:uncharacterized protein AMSG_11959 [Thecamonas trahens ATCC 50062]|uniref:Disease resistance R13L4/SHOC-2-like LRR domain-containing protein n=1 Tax=Thecamonas trahens ATCC 50062 TaxID=461836 RepID=A0A0L0DCU3_THETB|nr:hypothetical protein AMSG_11959 [Thecamonas trahens ATCC 50062]KNC50147.1 hypothetical protein AMSG_11959 [Thecamonas trahens ATCC 50062]|eukprot:XP_013757116.1 hypothetical protein AMSG_11959 [Thecamonas trahens ATCC 50062]